MSRLRVIKYKIKNIQIVAVKVFKLWLWNGAETLKYLYVWILSLVDKYN